MKLHHVIVIRTNWYTIIVFHYETKVWLLSLIVLVSSNLYFSIDQLILQKFPLKFQFN